MKRSKILLFDEDNVVDDINSEIAKHENNGWEVVDHRVSVAKSDHFSKVIITVLLQRDE
jgi:hypothetical protein